MTDSKPKNASEQSLETADDSSGQKDDAPSYYYDDAHGYEVFQIDEDENEDDSPSDDSTSNNR